MTHVGEPAPLGELELLGLAAVTWAAVMVAVDLPVLFGLACVGLALAVKPRRSRTAAAALGLVLLGSSLGASAEQAYSLAVSRSLADEPATLVTDTEPSDFGWRAEAKIDRTGQRVRLLGASFARPDLVAGQPVEVSGRLGPITASDWAKSRHLVGVVTGAEVRATGGLAWWRRPGEWLRSGVLGATDSFGDDAAALYHGLVIGDDRFQSEGQRAQFRTAGLSHLLAVSGQNVAFLLAVLAPLTARLRPAAGLGCVAIALLVFALATRLEPSVLRATATASVSTLAVMRSARAAGVRSLCVAVIALLLVDPFLSWSIGFRLSVGASLGILILGPVIRSRLGGPSWIATPASITLAAQIGVSPMLLWVFGPVASVTIPANLAAGWAAGAVMTLGLSVGIVASILPAEVGAFVQLPSRALVWWIDAVAAHAAAAPLPSVTFDSLPWLAVVVLMLWWLRPWALTPVWWLGPLAIAMAVSSPGQAEVDGWFAPTASTPSVLIIEDPTRRWVDIVVESRIRRVDVVVAVDGGWATARTVDRLRDVVEIGTVLAPGDHRIVGGRRVLADQVIDVGAGSIMITAGASRLDIGVVDAAAAVGDPQGDG